MSSGNVSGIQCAACGASYRWKPELAGKKVKCRCGGVVVVPAQMPAEAGSAPAASKLASQASSPQAAPVVAKPAAAPLAGAPDAPGASGNVAAPAPAPADPNAWKKSPGFMGLGALVALGLIVLWSGPVRAKYMKPTPTVIDQLSQVASLQEGDYVEVRLPLEDEAEIFEKKEGDNNYALIAVAGTEGKLRVCVANPSDDPHAQLPKPLAGRIVKYGGRKEGWELSGGSVTFSMPAQTRLIDPAEPPMYKVIGHLALMVVGLAVAIGCGVRMVMLLLKRPDTKAAVA